MLQVGGGIHHRGRGERGVGFGMSAFGDLCATRQRRVIPTEGRYPGCSSAGAGSAMRSVLDSKDFRFLTALRCVRNDSCRGLRSEYVMRVTILTIWNENGVGLCDVKGLMAGDGSPPRIVVRGRLFAGMTDAARTRRADQVAHPQPRQQLPHWKHTAGTGEPVESEPSVPQRQPSDRRDTFAVERPQQPVGNMAAGQRPNRRDSYDPRYSWQSGVPVPAGQRVNWLHTEGIGGQAATAVSHGRFDSV